MKRLGFFVAFPPPYQNGVWFFGPDGTVLEDFRDEEAANLLLEAAARRADGPEAFTLDLETGQVVVEVLEKRGEANYEAFEIVGEKRLSLEGFLR